MSEVAEENTGGDQSLVSAANLLVVAVLKLNRVIVPVLLKWQRGRRENWIMRASHDVAEDLRKRPGRRQLCVSECCLSTYREIGESSALLPPSRTDAPPGVDNRKGDSNQQGDEQGDDTRHEADDTTEKGKLLDNGEGDIVHAGDPLASEETRPTALEPWPPGDGVALSLFGPGAMTTQERYFRLLVLQEERHRQMKVVPWVYRSVLLTVFSLVSLVFYCVVIVGTVLALQDMAPRETVVFVFTLVATAVVSDADMLMAALHRKAPPAPATIEKKPDSESASVQPVGTTGAAPPPPPPASDAPSKPNAGTSVDASAKTGTLAGTAGTTLPADQQSSAMQPVRSGPQGTHCMMAEDFDDV